MRLNYDVEDKFGTFNNAVSGDAMMMHEFGHTFDSRNMGFSFIQAVGIPSILSIGLFNKEVSYSKYADRHSFRWFEMSANRHASSYFEKHFGVNWGTMKYGFTKGTVEQNYPLQKP